MKSARSKTSCSIAIQGAWPTLSFRLVAEEARWIGGGGTWLLSLGLSILGRPKADLNVLTVTVDRDRIYNNAPLFITLASTNIRAPIITMFTALRRKLRRSCWCRSFGSHNHGSEHTETPEHNDWARLLRGLREHGRKR